MRVEVLNNLVKSMSTILSTVAGQQDVKMLGKPSVAKDPSEEDAVSVLIGTTGELKSQIIFSMSEATALKIVNAMMMGMAGGTLGDMERSALSELSNMILGTFSTLMSQTEMLLDITIPTVIIGKGVSVSYSVKGVEIPVGNDEVKLKLLVIIKD